MFIQIARQWLAIISLTVLVTACGGGGGGGGSDSSATTNSAQESSSVSASTTSSSTSSGSLSESHSIHITWTVPTTRVDGSALAATALAGYRLFYSREDSSASEDAVVAIDGGNTTSADLTLAVAGTYLFAITAVDTDGVESELSTPVSVTVE